MGFLIFVALILMMTMVFAWAVCSFLLGYTAGRCWTIALPVMLVLTLLYIYFGLTSFSGKASMLSDIFGLVILAVVLFGAGVLFRYGLRKEGFLQITSIIGVVFMGAGVVYLALAFVSKNNSYSFVEEEFFWKSPYDDVLLDNTVVIRDQKLHINPFSSRVVAVFKYNDKGEYCGWSTSDNEWHKTVNNHFDEKYLRVITANATFVHKDYLPTVMAFMNDCQDAIYRKNNIYSITPSDNLTVFLYMKNDTLHRKELDLYQNGIISQMRSYTYYGHEGFKIDHIVEFDELGYRNNNIVFHGWHYGDFKESEEHLNIESKFGVEYFHDKTDYTDTQSDIVENFLSVESTYKDQDSALVATSLALPLDEYYQLGGINGKYIYVYIDKNAYKWTSPDTKSFESVKTIKDAQDIIQGLELSSLETGMWERIGEQSNVVGKDDECFRIMIAEGENNVNPMNDDRLKKRVILKDSATKTNKLVLYLFDQYAVTADSRFLFRRNTQKNNDENTERMFNELWSRILFDIFDDKYIDYNDSYELHISESDE